MRFIKQWPTFEQISIKFDMLEVHVQNCITYKDTDNPWIKQRELHVPQHNWITIKDAAVKRRT